MSESEVYLAIGQFVFWFSKLEGMLKSDLAGLLDLENQHLDPVMSAFDFAQLCSVLKAIKRKGLTDVAAKRVDDYFKDCMKVNDERVRVVHGDWTLAGVRVVSRGSREPKIYFSQPAELLRWSDKAKDLAQRYYEFTG
ncbi:MULTISPECIES: hypothetical protein [unclassified Bradyrhizobium]|uniref:hypothetical protein n=1 Tax=unclassified Bradyrhizobium TaxID=2631580 RepID=UPI0028E36807|nr:MULTISPECIES: hypothetical protein [unclassified Bradyrhizobium]